MLIRNKTFSKENQLCHCNRTMGEVAQGCFLQYRELKDLKILKAMVNLFYVLKK